MSAAADHSRLDELWEELAPHLEWPEGFSLVFLFAGHPRTAGELRLKLEESVRQRGKTLKVLDPEDAKAVEGLTRSVIAAPGAGCGALWISLLRQAGTREWTVAIRELLQRLNERRFLLERDVRVPVVILLPLELRADVYVLAPDLWTVRSFAEQVPGPENSQGVVLLESAAWQPFTPGPPSRVEVEWARLLSASDRRTLAAADGLTAFESAYDRGDLQAARRIALETLAIVLDPHGSRIESSDRIDIAEALAKAESLDARDQRVLSAALAALGEVEELAGNLAVARTLFQRALELRQTLSQAGFHGAQAQRELAVSCANLGEIEAQAGNLETARVLFQRSLRIAETLSQADPHDVEAQRDLFAFCIKLGDVEEQAGKLRWAQDLFQRARLITEGLSQADPHSAQVQRDLSVAYERLGNIEVRAGNLGAARDLVQRALQLRQALLQADPHSVRAQSDIGTSLIKLGGIEMVAGNLTMAQDLVQRSLLIDETLAKAEPQNANFTHDVVLSLVGLADIAAEQSNHLTELDHLRRAAAILDTMAANGQLAGFADRERLREEITRRLASSPAAGPTVDEPQPPSTPVPAQPDQPGAPPSPGSR